MTDAEVGEMLGMLGARYPEMPLNGDVIALWTNAFAKVDGERAFDATRYWCEKRPVPPTIADLQEMTYRMVLGREHGRRLAWEAYAADCRVRGVLPTHEYFEPEIEAVG